MQTAKHCRVEVENDTIVVTPKGNLGELDCELLTADMDGVLRILEQQRARNVVVDFRHTDFFGSDAIYLLLKIHRRVKENKGRMAFCGLSANQREVLSLMALDNMWPFCASQADALEYVGRHAIDILVVDDSEVDRCLAGGLLATNPDYHVAYARQWSRCADTNVSLAAGPGRQRSGDAGSGRSGTGGGGPTQLSAGARDSAHGTRQRGHCL